MTQASFFIWLAWALFATAIVFVVGTRYLRALRETAPFGSATSGSPAAAWLYCEDGAPLDKRVAWFRLRDGGSTVVGRQPRAATERASYVYLTAHDIPDQQVTIRYDRARKRYLIEPMDGRVLHNNELLTVGASAPLTDGDTVDLGEITRLRFSLTGPEENR